MAALVFLVGWGDLASALALHGPAMLAVDGVLLSAGVYGVLHAVAIIRALDSLPYVAGTYLFPASLIDARQPLLRVWSVGDTEGTEKAVLPEPALILRMRDGSRVVVPAGGIEDLERADAALSSFRTELTRALAEEDTGVLAELDPLHDRVLSNPVGPTASMKRALPIWIRFDWALAAAIGLSLGLLLGRVRNAASDDRIYKRVAIVATTQAYQQYLERGGLQSGEVRDVLLPRARLREAESEGVEALLAFAREYGQSKIAAEVDAAVRRGMLVELEKAKKTGTVSALDEFAQRYPHKVDAEVRFARHALFIEALSNWKKQSRGEPDATAFMERLLGVAEKSGPTCDVRFRFKLSKTLEEADKKIAKNDRYPGPDALPSHYVNAAALRPRELRVAESLAGAFKASFPPDMLLVRLGEPLSPDAPLETRIPTLLIEYAAEWARTITVSVKPSTAFAPINLTFDATFVLPEGPPRKVSTRWSHGIELWKLRSSGLSREEFEQKVYDVTIDPAFDQLGRKLRDAFL